jgi:hypothetical protein
LARLASPRYLLFMASSAPMVEEPETTDPEGDRVRLLRAVAQGLADDAAGRTMDTKALKLSLEQELGPIAWQ